MTGPFDQNRRQYPQAGPVQPGFPGGMREVDLPSAALVRPNVVAAAFMFWLVAALMWPVGTVVRVLAEEGTFAGSGPIITLFGTTCLGIAGVWGAVAFIKGSYNARLGLCGGWLVIGILAVATAVLAAQDETTEPVSWLVIALRLVLPAIAAVFSFLPGTRNYFAGNLG